MQHVVLELSKLNMFINILSTLIKKNYTYGYEYYSYGKILLSKTLKSCETAVGMNYPSKGKYTKIRPIIDWFSILLGYFRALIDGVKFEK